MSKVYVLFAEGFEEIEGLTVVDLMRRAGIEVVMTSINLSDTVVKGARGITITTDISIENAIEEGDMVVLPGGMPGTTNLMNSAYVRDMVSNYYEAGKYVAAICAAPTVLSDLGILADKRATSYPGMQASVKCAKYDDHSSVVVDGNVITSRGLGTAIDFSLKLIELLKDKESADKIAESVVYKVAE